MRLENAVPQKPAHTLDSPGRCALQQHPCKHIVKHLCYKISRLPDGCGQCTNGKCGRACPVLMKNW